MKASNTAWKQRLAGQIESRLAAEIDKFENEIILRKQGKIDEKVFAETRLRRGAYGQRYDNGQRNDGTGSKTLSYPSELTKGPHTLWDAPGMQRIKIPFGGLSANQMEALADLAEEYSDGILHVTTRQDFQLHFVHIDDTPSIMRRLAAVGITTREACGNTVRNVTACPIAGVCRDQVFDVTPYAKATAYFLLGHPDTQDFGRKFKISFSGCWEHACALAHMHDIGAVGTVRDGQRGFRLLVGGGLGSVPQQAQVFDEFVREQELIPIAQAICRVFARLGEKKNRNTARLKFLVSKLGMDEFRRLVYEERAGLKAEEGWTSYLKDLHATDETPRKPGGELHQIGANQAGAGPDKDFEEWYRTNVYAQRQEGYATVTVSLPLGDITSAQMRRLASLAREHVNDTVRTTVEQNLVLRWVSLAEVRRLYGELKAIGLAEPGAGTIVDVTACPGTDTCKLGISSSRGLAGELRVRLASQAMEMDQAVRGLHIKVSGCFNSCGQHHIADLGFYGVSRNKGGYAVPHFQVVLGGMWQENGGSYGLAIGAVPSKRIPEAVERLTSRYLAERAGGERFQEWIKRIGKAAAKTMLEDLMPAPAHDADPSFYVDWADAREYSIGDLGVGECAGEVVSPIEFALVSAEREAFEAQLALEAGDRARAARGAYEAMLHCAAALVKQVVPSIAEEPDAIVAKFREHFYDTQLFFDPFAAGKFAQYFFFAHDGRGEEARAVGRAHQLVEEAQLFIEAAHACHARMLTAPSQGGR